MEKFKQWPWEAYPAEGTSTPPRPDQCHNLVDITQFVWNNGEISEDLGWTILVLIPKGNSDTRGISLEELLWKVVEAIIGTHLRTSVSPHDNIYGLRTWRGTVMAILKLKLEQELASAYHNPLFLVFLDSQKAYNTVDQVCLMTTLEGYGAGPQM